MRSLSTSLRISHFKTLIFLVILSGMTTGCLKMLLLENPQGFQYQTPTFSSPSSDDPLYLEINSTFQLEITGGLAPFEYQVVFGSLTIDNQGLITAGSSIETGGIAVTDAKGMVLSKTIVTYQLGGPDPTFGVNGVVYFSPYKENAEQAKDILSDSSGNIFVLSQIAVGTGATHDTFITKILPTGDLDTTYGTSGFAQFDAKGSSDIGKVMITDSLGRFVVAAKSFIPGGTLYAYSIFRSSEDGQLDATFRTSGAGDGTIYFNIEAGGVDEELTSIAEDADGNYVFVGFVETANINSIIGRVDDQGVFDPTFNTTGYRIVDFSSMIGGSGADKSWDLIIDSNNKMLVGGNAWSGAATSNNLFVARFEADSTLDETFCPTALTPGVCSFDFDGLDDLFSDFVLVGSDLYVAGKSMQSATSNYDIVLIKMNAATGALDTEFGVSGVFSWDSGGTDSIYGPKTIVFDQAGRILLFGETFDSVSGGTHPVILRLTAEGILDTTFGTTGAMILPVVTGLTHVVRAATFDGLDHLYFTGWVTTPDYDQDIFVMKLMYPEE